MGSVASSRFYRDKARRYWNLVDVETGQAIGSTLRPTFRETVERELREISGNDLQPCFRLEETTEEELLRVIEKQERGMERWARTLIDLREDAHRHPIKKSDLEKLKGTPAPGRVIKGWGLHLLFCDDEEGEMGGAFFYGLMAVRFDGKFDEKISADLNSILMGLGAIPPPEPVLLGLDVYYFAFRADVDVPVDA